MLLGPRGWPWSSPSTLVSTVDANTVRCRRASVRFASVRFARNRIVPIRIAPVRFAPARFVPDRFARDRCALVKVSLERSGKMLGFSSRHVFHAATPCLNIATCSSFATEAPLNSAPILFGLTFHRGRVRVLELEPIRRAAAAVARAEPLRHDALASELAGV